MESKEVKQSIYEVSESEFRKRIVDFVKNQNIVITDLQNQIETLTEQLDTTNLVDRIEQLEQAERMRIHFE